MRTAINALAGLVFGLGLLISGMANPAKVQNFLDLAGTFDPSLIFVMLGAVVATFLGYRLAFRRSRPVLAERFSLPTSKDVDARVVLGPALFGIGWGLSGFCPGPAITSLPLLAKGTLIFVPAMLIGIGLARLLVQGGPPERSSRLARARLSRHTEVCGSKEQHEHELINNPESGIGGAKSGYAAEMQSALMLASTANIPFGGPSVWPIAKVQPEQYAG